MSLFSEIYAGYLDGNTLVTPGKAIPGQMQGSDNGLMYTSEMRILSIYNKDTGCLPMEALDYSCRLRSCQQASGLFNRAPQSRGQEGPDDYYGICAAIAVFRRFSPSWHKAWGLRKIALQMLWHGFTHFGFYNNSGAGGLNAFLWRQPQMIAAMASAAGIGFIPIFWSFYFWTFLVILISCINTPPNKTDPRRLSWHLIQATWQSPLTKIAAYFWYKRLYKDYGSDGMKAVARIYYKDNHPFQRYWVDKQPD